MEKIPIQTMSRKCHRMPSRSTDVLTTGSCPKITICTEITISHSDAVATCSPCSGTSAQNDDSQPEAAGRAALVQHRDEIVQLVDEEHDAERQRQAQPGQQARVVPVVLHRQRRHPHRQTRGQQHHCLDEDGARAVFVDDACC